MFFFRKSAIQSRARAYPGRIIFDHQAKTGGQAVNRWLREQLGAGCVTPNLVSKHASAIRRYGGAHSIISGHIHFSSGEFLDPRYDYVTLFREPTDRVVSWTYYLVNEVPESAENARLVSGARLFLETDGREASEAFLETIRNQAVAHFSATTPMRFADDAARLNSAKAFLDGYTLVGLYENLPGFISELAVLIGLPPPKSVPRTNETRDRLPTASITPALRARIEELTALDRALYEWVSTQTRRTRETPTGHWEAFPGPKFLEMASEAAQILPAGRPDLGRFCAGAQVKLELKIKLLQPVEDLVVGMHIHDEFGRLAFGINSAELAHTIGQCAPGVYEFKYTCVADLPFGHYRAGFAAVNRLPDGQFEHLAWRDGLLAFEISEAQSTRFSGYRHLTTQLELNSREDD